MQPKPTQCQSSQWLTGINVFWLAKTKLRPLYNDSCILNVILLNYSISLLQDETHGQICSLDRQRTWFWDTACLCCSFTLICSVHSLMLKGLHLLKIISSASCPAGTSISDVIAHMWSLFGILEWFKQKFELLLIELLFTGANVSLLALNLFINLIKPTWRSQWSLRNVSRIPPDSGEKDI